MAIAQDTIITVGSGSDARTFGISKSLNNYTIDELLGIGEWAYSAYNDDEMNANVYSDINTSGTMIDIADGQYASRVVCYPDNQLMSKGYNTNSEGVFFRNVLIYYDVTETNWVSSSVNVDAGRFPHYYVVTDIDLQDLVINALSDPNAVAPSYTTMKLGVNDVTIAPFQLYLDQNGELSLNMLLPPVGGRSSTINSNSDLVCYSVSYGNWSVYTASGGGGRNIKDQMPFHFFNPNHVDYPFQNSRIPGTQVLTDADKLIQCVKTDAPDTPARFHFQYKVELMDKPYIDSARCGIRFKINDTLYKPIVENGMITGYTDDDTVQSEWDEWQTIKDHVTPSVPPSPTPSGDDAEPETFGWGGNEVGGMVHYYLLTQSEMESLAGFMSNPNWTIDYRNCIVSMFIIPNNGTVVFDDDTFEPTTVKFRLDENNKVDTGISCNRIHNVVNNHETIEIPRMNNNFFDYEPYSKYYVYVPFCGVTSLPDYIAGKEITVSIYPDVPTCSCTAVISSEDRKIATLRGNFGSSIPVTSDGSGLKTAAVINSVANGLVGVGEMVAGAGLGNPGLVIGGGMTAISSILQTSLTLGQAFGYSVGSSGDTSFFGIGNRCEYYITYPQWNNPDGEDTNIYGHTYGFVVNKRGIIGDFEGFTVCDNPHVTGFSCTSDEKDEIERLLREGIIIHKPSE